MDTANDAGVSDVNRFKATLEYYNKLNELINLTHCIHENCNENKFEKSFFCFDHINKKPKWNLNISRQNIREATLKKNSELNGATIYL